MPGSEHPALPSTGRVAVIAGSGRLPEDVAAALVASGRDPFVVLVAGEAVPDRLSKHDHAVLALEHFGDLVPLLKKNGVTNAVLAGGIGRRPELSSAKFSLGLLRFLPKAIGALGRGDDALLKAVIGHIEASGIGIIAAQAIVPDVLTAAGPLTRRSPTEQDRRDMKAAFAAARAIGALDIGQAAVAIGGRVIALEGIEGTDRLLERVKPLRSHGRIAGAQGGVLVKCAKPGQELRADLPSIGVATVEAAHQAGLSGIALQAGHSFVLDHGAAVARADALGLFLFGLSEEDGR